MPAIGVPAFARREFPITDFGAIQDDQAATSKAIQAAIAACHAAGGGRVVIPPGHWLTGPVHLQSNVELHLLKDSFLVFSGDPLDYLPAVQSSWEGWECFNYSPLIYAFDCDNVALTGEGTIQPRMEVWRTWFQRTPAHLQALKRLYTMGSTGVPVGKRQMATGENHLRPQLVQFNRCRHILVQGVHIRGSPFWTLHFLLCASVVVRGVDIVARGQNNDGIDVESTRDLLVEMCRFNQGDDVIAIKSGTDQDGWRLARPSENVVIRNCTVIDGHQLIAIGSELSGGVRNVYVHDCRFEAANAETSLFNVLYVKTNRRRGGFVENVTVAGIDASGISFREGILGVGTDVLYQWRNLVPSYGERLTSIRGITVREVKARATLTPFRIFGDQDQPVSDVTLDNIHIGSVKGQRRHYEHAERVQEDNISIDHFVAAPDVSNGSR